LRVSISLFPAAEGFDLLFSSSVSQRSATLLSQSAGMSVTIASGIDCTPLKYCANARSKRSKYAPSFTSVMRG